MSELNKATARLEGILAPPVGSTNETKVFEPLDSDPNARLKAELIDRAFRTLQLSREAQELDLRNLQVLENHYFDKVMALPDSDHEKPDYFELVNAIQAVLVATNRRPYVEPSL